MSGTFHGFEGSYLGDATRLTPDAVMECKICWSVYDPAQGCDTWQVPPGTPFAALPEHWRCPTCDGARDQFMVVHGAVASGPVQPAPAPAAPRPEAERTPAALLAARLEEAFREIHVGKMRGIPLLNEALGVKAVGFRAYDGHLLGVLVTPWFMNLILAPGADDDWSALASGAKELIAFPSGTYEFTAVNRTAQGAELPPYKACALFSPMFEFSTMLQATDTAEATLRGLLDPTLHPEYVAPPPPAPPAAMGRRGLLFGAPQGASQPGA
ncbi:rubredoxin [Gluconacetobacter johannae DSM 13595]|uniref:[NiFe]-hydrogenase assembly chaperone HybE n=1 Tax=Gluconacetobacter johannae TaxID=112140 RepID=A0A7W4P788_9PROT|nr:[NiFe]-hydrogenase assembly chaperone HybE [Gluconacetobacter johannae]MBB2176685.1 [NiFe]-hydrogenase assembly chaperone HybE [Gluconacetobacter johannae]GBQ91335.1 rubredoxin [Gluconacetobacter johannae DSM 13595]